MDTSGHRFLALEGTKITFYDNNGRFFATIGFKMHFTLDARSAARPC